MTLYLIHLTLYTNRLNMQYKRVYSKVRLNGNKQKYGVTDTTVKRSMLISIFLRLPYTMTAYE